jgi:hypothetical protein
VVPFALEARLPGPFPAAAAVAVQKAWQANQEVCRIQDSAVEKLTMTV